MNNKPWSIAKILEAIVLAPASAVICYVTLAYLIIVPLRLLYMAGSGTPQPFAGAAVTVIASVINMVILWRLLLGERTALRSKKGVLIALALIAGLIGFWVGWPQFLQSKGKAAMSFVVISMVCLDIKALAGIFKESVN